MSLDLPFTPEELLDFWQQTWFPLSEAQQQKFLDKAETCTLCKWPRSKVMMFVKKEKKLQIVLSDLRIEAQSIAELERVRELDASLAKLGTLKKIPTANGWCDICSCNHPFAQHQDHGSHP